MCMASQFLKIQERERGRRRDHENKPEMDLKGSQFIFDIFREASKLWRVSFVVVLPDDILISA